MDFEQRGVFQAKGSAAWERPRYGRGALFCWCWFETTKVRDVSEGQWTGEGGQELTALLILRLSHEPYAPKGSLPCSILS